VETTLIHSLDVSFDTWLNAYRMAPWTAVLIWFTHWGAGPTLIAVMTTTSGFVYAAGRYRMLLPLWLGFAGAEALTWSLKYAVARERPDFLLGVTAQSPSFPSAHAAGAAVVYGLLACALIRLIKTVQARKIVVLMASALILLIGFSRIYLNVHYVSDVMAGWLIGLSWVGLAWLWLRRI
jgi:undecaprenyl-diphosphatase